MHLARLGDESVERFGEYTALHFEGRDLTNVDQQLAAKVEGWSGPVILVGGHWDEWLARESDAFATVERADGDLAVIL